ncbi:MAG TPA: electron transport complex subunit RsxC [Prolixibacteraceae bacterium]
MKILKTFRFGGIHPGAEKLTAGRTIRVLSLPEKVILPVVQHAGSPAAVIVKVGDRVKTGSLIARMSGAVSANIHASVSGIVTKIEETVDASGYKINSVQITREGDDWDDSVSLTPVIKDFTPQEILQKIKEAGIVGMGGASFPTHVKLEIPEGMKVDTLLINGVECEPYLTADHQLMLEKGEEILQGTQLLMKVLGVDRAIIGIEVNKPDAIHSLNNLSKKYVGITVEALAMKYPQGSEKQLIQALTGRQVPPGALPASVGVLVNNVATTYAVYEAVTKNKPLIERVVTVTGKSVKLPGNFLVRIGTPINELIEAVGGMPENTGKVVIGGPMMGRTVANLHIPVTKGMSGIVLIPDSEASRQTDLPCIRCAKCVEGCPMNLEPYLMMQLVEKGMWDLAEENHITDCMECGSCSFTCPSARPILDNIRIGKSKIRKIRSDQQKSNAKS